MYFQRDAASQMRSKLQYQSEQQIDDLVRKLEQQLQQHSFRLSEERRLVAEIDKLRRSKKAVRQYNEAKEELNTLRESQQSLRLERDSISNNFSTFRTQEDEIHGSFKKNKEQVDTLKKGILKTKYIQLLISSNCVTYQILGCLIFYLVIVKKVFFLN